jgi:hypothetical protein
MSRLTISFAGLSILAILLASCRKESPTEPKDTTPPTVSILSPSNNSPLADTIFIRVQATDNAAVTRIEFYIDGLLVVTRVSVPWECKWLTKDLQGLNPHTIVVKAYDAAGNIGTSPTDTVRITPPTVGLWTYYPFSGNANDSSLNNNNCVVNGAFLTTDRFGNANKAYLFNGITSYLISSRNIGIAGAQPRTISIWVYTQAFPGTSSVCGWGLTGVIGEMSCLKLLGPTPMFNGNYQDLTASQSVNLNAWYHICFTYDGSVGKIYVNGVLSGSQALSLNATDTKMSFGYEFGGHGPDWNMHFNGKLSDARIYNRALTDQEVLILYNEPNPSQSR